MDEGGVCVDSDSGPNRGRGQSRTTTRFLSVSDRAGITARRSLNRANLYFSQPTPDTPQVLIVSH